MYREVKLADFVQTSQFDHLASFKVHVPPFDDMSNNETSPEQLSQNFYGVSKFLSFDLQERSFAFRANGCFLEVHEVSLKGNEVNHKLELRFSSPIVPSLTFSEINEIESSSTNFVGGFNLWLVTESRVLHKIAFRIPSDPKSSLVANLSTEFHSSRHEFSRLKKGRGYRMTVLHYISDDRLAIGLENGGIILATHQTDYASEQEFSTISMTQKLWSVFSRSKSAYSVLGIESYEAQGEFLLCLCSDAYIRIWSLDTNSCICTYPLIEMIDDERITIENASMKLVARDQDENDNLVVHFKNNNLGRFMNLQIIPQTAEESIIDLQSENVKYDPELDEYSKLVDFTMVGPDIWALWVSKKPSYTVTHTSFLQQKEDKSTWYYAHSLLDDFVKFEPAEKITSEMKQRLLSKISNNRFIPRQLLLQRLNVPFDFLTVSEIEIHEFIEEKILEERMQLEQAFPNPPHSEKALYERQTRAELLAWKNLYAACFGVWLEYYMPASFAFFSSDRRAIGLITGSGLSMLRPCDPIETLYVESTLKHDQRRDFIEFFEAKSLSDHIDREDVLRLIDAIHFVRERIGEDHILDFDHSIRYEDDPLDSIYTYVKILTAGVRDGYPIQQQTFMLDFRRKLAGIKNLKASIDVLATLLEGNTAFEDTSHGLIYPNPASNQRIFNNINVRLICDISTQILQTRYELCRDLLLFLSLLANCQSSVGLRDLEVRTHIETHLCAEVAVLLKTYHTLSWLATQYLTPPSAINGNIYNLSNALVAVNKLRPSLTKKGYFLEVFVSESADDFSSALDQLQSKNSSRFLSSHTNTLLFLALKTIEYLWSVKDEEKQNALDVAQILWLGQQYDILKEYCRLAVGHIPHLYHFMALCYLQAGQSNKAKDAFLKAGSNIANSNKLSQSMKIFESFDPNPLRDMAIDQIDKLLSNRALFYYFNAVRQLCEKHPDLVVEFATIALEEVDSYEAFDDFDRNVIEEESAILCSVIFSYNLSAERFDDAYVAITLNNDDFRKKSDLRRFINVLCDKGLFSRLVSYPFVGMSNVVEDILDQKARASDIAKKPNYYEMLYAFNIHQNKIAKAANAMYHFAKRLGKESDMGGAEYLRRQAECLVTVISSLKVLPKVEQWLLFPTSADEQKAAVPPSHLKRGREDESVSEVWASAKTELSHSKVVTISTVEKEYALVQAKLLLVERHPSKIEASQVHALKPEDLLVLLCSGGMYDMAFTLCKHFQLASRTKEIFISLTIHCLERQLNSKDQPVTTLILEEDITAYGNAFVSPIDQIWNLLQSYLEQYDSGSNICEYHRVVLDQIFSASPTLTPPYWLTNNLQHRNPTQLIKLYMKYNKIEEAVKVAQGYIRSVLSAGPSTVDRVVSLPVLEHLSQVANNKILTKKLEELISSYAAS